MKVLKEFKESNDKELLRLLLLKWLCNNNAWAAKYMHELSSLFGKEFTTKDLPFKSSHSYELIKEWAQKGLVRVTDYTSKARKYEFTTTLFAQTIEQQKINNETKQALLERLDDLLNK